MRKDITETGWKMMRDDTLATYAKFRSQVLAAAVYSAAAQMIGKLIPAPTTRELPSSVAPDAIVWK